MRPDKRRNKHDGYWQDDNGMMTTGAGCDLRTGNWAGSKLDSGDYIGAAWGASPYLTPYAEAIAANYSIQIPWYYSQKVSVQSGGFNRSIFTTRPYLYDVLIIGMSAKSISNPAFTPLIGLQIMDLQRAIPWVSPNTVGYAPLGSLAGIDLNPMPILKLPEAFFLPAHTMMRIETTAITEENVGLIEATITFVGIQLVNPPAFTTPETIKMPNGDVIKVGSRMPWLSTVPFGRQEFDPARGRMWGLWGLIQGERAMQFLPPADCDVEIHDAYSDIFDAAVIPPDQVQFLTIKLTDMRSRSDWTPGRAPATAVLGSERQAFPGIPFTKPHLLLTGHRVAISLQNNSITNVIESGVLTLRGVRLCEY